MAAVMRRMAADLLYGTILAAAAAGVSCLLALVGYGRPYYLSVFLPVSMLGCILIAWILHLRGDRLLRAEKAGVAGDGNPFAGAKRALLWAAAELAVAATLLYSLWGIGSVYG
jgi:hypothetical protein